jgi:hypothetical protein
MGSVIGVLAQDDRFDLIKRGEVKGVEKERSGWIEDRPAALGSKV